MDQIIVKEIKKLKKTISIIILIFLTSSSYQGNSNEILYFFDEIDQKY